MNTVLHKIALANGFVAKSATPLGTVYIEERTQVELTIYSHSGWEFCYDRSRSATFKGVGPDTLEHHLTRLSVTGRMEIL